jgi:hypothetical protein
MLPNVQLRHAGPNDVNREAELETPSRVACSDLILPVKPFWFFDNMSNRAGSETTLPA